MKKLSILLSYLFISLSITAQKTSGKTTPVDNFCNTLSKVIAHAPSQFEKLKTGGHLAFLDPITSSWVGNGWVTSINFPGAFLSNINKGENALATYNAWFGAFQSEADAKKRANTIKKQLMTCLPDYAVEDRSYMENDLQGFPLNFFFIGKKKGNNPQQIINLVLTKDSSIHSIFLQILGSDVSGNVLKEIMKKPVTEKKELDNETSQATKDIFDQIFNDIAKWDALQPNTTSVSPAKPKLAKQLLELLKHAETKYESIKGEKNLKESTTYGGLGKLDVYETSYQLEGAIKNRVEDFDNNRLYTAIYSEEANEDAATSLFNDLFTKIKSGLGDTFNYENDKSLYFDGAKAFMISPKEKGTHKIKLGLSVDDLGLGKKWGVYIKVF